MKAVLYARVSSKEQEKEGYSIPAQLRLLKEYAQKNSLTIVKEFIDVETAKQAGRANFGEMIKFLEKDPAVKIILVEKTDRLYRNFKDYVIIDDLDLEIHLVKEGEVLSKDSKSHQKFIHGIKVLLAKNYIDNLSEETKKGLKEKAEQGYYPGHARLGYRNNPETHQIEVDPEKAVIVKKMFEWYSTGNCSLAEIREKVIDEGLVYSKSQPRISKSHVERTLKNPVYYGDFWWNGKLYKGRHQPIISRELFDKVQEAFSNRNRSKGRKRDFAFTGLLMCGHCGCSITAEIHKNRYIYYRCTGFKGKCGQPYIREELLEEELGELVRSIVIDDERLEWIKEALKSSHVDEKAYHDEMIAKLTLQLKRLQQKLDQAYEDKLEGKIEEEFWSKKSEQWREEQSGIVSKITYHQNANKSYFDEGIKILELANKAYFLYQKQEAHEKRKLLNYILSNCQVIDGTLYPTYRKLFD
ncbi:MAG: recombinase family protein [Candidatus Zixiibacteriota bacterium]